DNRSGKLVLRKAVDYEKIQRFDVEIEACDHGAPILCSTLDIPIIVKDVNDNSPEFHCSTFYAALPLNSPPGTLVTTVTAVDRDSGVAGRVYYALLDAITGFTIDRSTGEIRTTESLKDKVYKIRIGAMDGNGVMSTNNATVTLYTTNSSIFGWTEGPDTIDVNASVVAGDVLTTYKTTPASSIKSTSQLLSIDGQGRLTITSSIPNKTDALHAVLIAESSGVSISKCIQLRIIRDPSPPAFPKKTIKMKLARDSPLGMQVLKVDPGVESEFKSDCRWFRIDGNGVVSVKELIDKSIDSVQCAVEAQDLKGRKDVLKLQLTMETLEKVNRLS
ncbi:unnamed protein product, partial [Strongylus vulgaris]